MSNTRLEQFGAACGIIFVVMQMASQALMQIGGSEPPFNAPAETIAAFLAARNYQLFMAGEYLSSLSLIAFLWFTGSLWATLRRAEGETGWLSFVAAASGVLVLATVAGGAGWSLAVFRQAEGVDPQIARLLFDQGNFAFANAWVMLASLLLATGIVSIRTGALPRWLGWAGVAIAAGLLAARAAWASSGLVFIPFLFCYLWLIATSVVLIRRARAAEQPRHIARGLSVS